MKAEWSALIDAHLAEHFSLLQNIREQLEPDIAAAASLLLEAIERNQRLFLCGNGGSAADAQHIAAEFTGRFVRERRPLPAIALTTDTSALTAIGNDYGIEQIFSRQLQGLAVAGDVVVLISTSGNSPNLLAAARVAEKIGCRSIGLLGKDGGALAKLVNSSIIVPSQSTARIQEMHILIGHIWCDLIDRHFA